MKRCFLVGLLAIAQRHSPAYQMFITLQTKRVQIQSSSKSSSSPRVPVRYFSCSLRKMLENLGEAAETLSLRRNLDHLRESSRANENGPINIELSDPRMLICRTRTCAICSQRTLAYFVHPPPAPPPASSRDPLRDSANEMPTFSGQISCSISPRFNTKV